MKTSAMGAASRWMWLLLATGLATALSPAHDVFGGAHPKSKAGSSGNAEAGRSVFNGKGVCYYCHGVDGYRDTLPQLESHTVELIGQLNPPPPDLRNAKSLKLGTDKERARAIREGHEGTGMFPDRTMTDQELADTLAYLSLLRKEGNAKRP